LFLLPGFSLLRFCYNTICMCVRVLRRETMHMCRRKRPNIIQHFSRNIQEIKWNNAVNIIKSSSKRISSSEQEPILICLGGP
jgi:hypothetical protein